MNYFLSYNKKTGNIISMCKALDADSLPEPRTPEERFIEVTQKKQIEAIASMNPLNGKIKGKVQKEKIVNFAIEPLFQGEIKLTTNVKDYDGDNIPELPADGKSTAKINATILDAQGRTVKDKSVTVEFHVSRGTLSSRMEQTKNGIAEVELRSTLETTQCEISASAPEFRSSFLLLEFIPVAEYEMLTRGKRKK